MGDLVAALHRGELDELAIVRALRSPYCTAAFVEAVAASPWATSRHRVLAALVRHPHCPRTFAWRALPQLGWRDLLDVASDPRAPMPVRRQAEAKLLERVPLLSLGEKVALARAATAYVIGELCGEHDPKVVAALLDNPRFNQGHCLRLVAQTRAAEVFGLVLRHRTWGTLPAVRLAALANPALPVPLALSLLASLEDRELRELVQRAELPAAARELAKQVLWVRDLRAQCEPGYLH